MRTIYKYPLTRQSLQSIRMPRGAQILTVQAQENEACLWAEVETDFPAEERWIETFGTGKPMSELPRRYLGSAQLDGGSVVAHVYERFERQHAIELMIPVRRARAVNES